MSIHLTQGKRQPLAKRVLWVSKKLQITGVSLQNTRSEDYLCRRKISLHRVLTMFFTEHAAQSTFYPQGLWVRLLPRGKTPHIV